MKSFKITIAAVATVMLALTSCSDNGYWNEYKSDPSYSFVTKEQSYDFDGNMPEYVTVYVNRSDADAAATVPVTLETESDQITGAAEVAFAAGQGQAEYKLMLGSGLECGVDIKATLTLEGNVADHNLAATTITFYRAYTFKPLGEGMIVSPEFIGIDWPVNVEVANENSHVFRILDPYYVLYEDENTSGVAQMLITCNSDFTKAVFKNFFPGFYYSGYEIYYKLYDYGAIDGNDITFPVNLAAYIDGVYQGSFGVCNETVVMPDGWKN